MGAIGEEGGGVVITTFIVETAEGEYSATWYGENAATVATEHGCRILNSCPGWCLLEQKMADGSTVLLQMKWDERHTIVVSSRRPNETEFGYAMRVQHTLENP